MKPEEVKYFDIESRVREIISEFVAPILRREADARDNIIRLEKKTENQKRQINDLEATNSKTAKKIMRLDDFSKEFLRMEALIRTVEADINRKQGDLEAHVEHLNFDLERSGQLLKQLEDRNVFLDKELTAVHTVITQHKEATSKIVREMQLTVDKKCLELAEASNATDLTSREATQKIAELLKLGPRVTTQIEAMKKLVSDCEGEVALMKKNKLEERDLMTLRKDLQIEIGRIKESSFAIEKRVKSVEAFVIKYTPAQIHSSLSEALHSSLEYDSLLRFSEYERRLISEIKESLVTKPLSIEEAEDFYIESISRAELRAQQPIMRKEESRKTLNEMMMTTPDLGITPDLLNPEEPSAFDDDITLEANPEVSQAHRSSSVASKRSSVHSINRSISRSSSVHGEEQKTEQE
eukprot:CAMPEP_0204901520 /NCGR_PEP_ID=MMETSP1397-20131031/3126_1 /ASSEMBLY_ACC=CAM_ASM_000891 /TAXON_ID=49980 /ORGANISM="Climacostomum Climacostomum virens, Strain Stock W-24" /LENGTH=409 /DNA_ID=CAMNT_0052069887 /DNA_START=499 /DNA_END=1728 /DNA_ORIENTATION=+